MVVKLITDSTSYIPIDLQEEFDIAVVPLSVNFPDESFLETEVDYAYFYKKVETGGVIPTSSQPSTGEMYRRFRLLVEKGYDIVAIFISSLMSGTYESALSVREQLLKEFPQAQINVLDSQTNCMSLGYPVLEAARAAARGLSFSEVSALASDLIKRMNFYFTPASLEYLKKGGRIGGAAALLGQILRIRPVLFVDKGATNVFRVARSFKSAINEMLNIMDRDYRQHGLRQVIVQDIDFPDKAKEVAQMIKQRYNLDAPIIPIGPIIGLHVGPGTIGLVYCTGE